MKKSIIAIFGKKLKNVDIEEINKTNIDLRDLTPQNIRLILQKEPQERTNEEIAYLKNFILKKSRFIDKLTKEHMDEQTQNIIIILSMSNAFYKLIKKSEEVIYDINDKSKNFYIILNGKVGVYDIEKIDAEMNMEEYYKLILNYRNNKEQFLLEKTLKENKVNIPIDINDVYRLDKILLKIYLLSKKGLKFYKNNPHFLDEIFEKLGFKYSDFKIQSYEESLEQKNKQIKEDNYNNEELKEYNEDEALKFCRLNEDKVFESINLQISDSLCKKYSFLIRANELPISYYRYIEKKMLSDLDYFGDSYFGACKEKIVAKTNNLELLYFKNDIYNEYDLNMKLKFAGTQDQFLLNNFFLNSISKSTFEKVYLKYFEYIKYFAHQTIIEENEPISYIYFIKSGNVKLYSSRSIIQNHLLIQIIINILKQKCPNIDTKNSNFKSYSGLKVDFDKIKEEMDFNRNIHIMNFNQKQCIGFECFYFGFNSLYTAKAISEKVEVYRISIDRLYKILSIKNKKALYDFAIQAEKALKILLDRLIVVNNMLILNYSEKNKNVLKEASDYMEREILLNQIKTEEMKGIMNTKYSRIIEQKKFEQNKSCYDVNYNYNSNKNVNIKDKHALLSCPKRKNTRLDLKKNFKFDRNKLIQKMALTKNTHKILDNLGINYKLYDTRENLARQRNRELLRESSELERLSNEEKRKIHYLKLQNKISKDFVRLSKGEKRIFINSSNSMNLSTIPHHYSFRKRNIFLISKNKFKTSKALDKDLKKREFFPNLHKSEEKSTNVDSINDMAINGKWIQLNKIKSIENSSTNSDREIHTKERVNVFKKSTEGNNNIYKKYIIKDIYK